MRIWPRRIAAVAAGLLVSVVLIMVVQAGNLWLFPPPPGLDLSDPDVLESLARQMPVGALLLVELSYLVGSLGGGATTGLIAPGRVDGLAAVVGVLLTLAGFANLAAIPHPAWFAVLSTVTYVPCAWLGARGVSR